MMNEQAILNEDTLFGWFTDLHRHPETAGEEFRTTEKVRSVLSEHRIGLLETGLPTGVLARIGKRFRAERRL